MKFDARAAKQLQAGEHIIVEGCPGLRLVGGATKRSWTYRYKAADGRMKQYTLGRWPAMGVAAAAVEVERLKSEREHGHDPAAGKRAERAAKAAVVTAESPYTLKKLCDDYLSGHVDVHRKAKGAKEVRRIFDTMLGDLSEVVASSLTRAQAFRLLESHAERPVVASSLRSELGAAYDYALDAGRIPEETPNWWRQIMRGRLRSKGRTLLGKRVGAGKRVLSEQETGELIRWLPNFPALADDALTLYLWTATRGAEIMAMEASEITEEQDGWWWTVPKAKTKNARVELATDLRVPLVGRAETVVRRRLGLYSSGYLFPSRGKAGYVEQKTIGVAVHYRMPYSEAHPEHERARLPMTRWGPHDLRRTARTLLASLGCPDSVGEAILGHIQPGIIGVYNRHNYDNERRKWLQVLDVKLEALATTPAADGA